MFYCTREVLKKSMLKRHSGRIINIASIWGETGASCEVAYSASKAAVIGFSKALKKELEFSGIQVNYISPGFIETDMNNNLTREEINFIKRNKKLYKFNKKEEIAKKIFDLACF